MHEITFRVSVTPWRIRLLLLLLLLAGFPQVSSTQDEPVLWGYFPPPSGTYPGVAVGDGSSTVPIDLARDFGNVGVGNNSPANPNMQLIVRPAGSPPFSEPAPNWHPRKARIVVKGTLRINGCIFLKNGNTGAGGSAGAYTAGNYDTSMFWRCNYNP